MFKKGLINVTIILVYSICCCFLYNRGQKSSYQQSIKTTSTVLSNSQNNKTLETKEIGILTIDKIQLKNKIYPLNSQHNNVEENVTILQGSISPEKEHSILFLAAHSGTGEVAFFNRLDEMKIGDTIQLQYKEKNYTYQVTVIEEQPKNGKITIPKNNEKELVLTTCSRKDKSKQLVIISKIK